MSKIKELKGKKLKVEVSLYEAAMLQRLRKFEFGTFTIVKMHGEPRRFIEVQGSVMLQEEEGLQLAEVVK